MERCSIRLCRCEAVGESPVTCQPLCTSHMQDDLTELEVSEARVADRIQHFKKYQAPLRMMQQRLASDLQLLDDTFADLRETLDRCQSEIISVITKQHDQLLDSLTSVSELDDFQKELKQVKDENNMRQAFLINRSMERSLRTLQLDSKLVRMDEKEENVNIVAYPDLNSMIKELQMGVRTELTFHRMSLEELDVDDSKMLGIQDLHTEESTKVANLGETERALCLMVCKNTGGFVIDDSGSIAKAAEDSSGSQLPQPSIFVAVEALESNDDSESSPDDKSDSNAKESKVLLLSADAEVVGRLPCSWEADQPIMDLHCDNERQLLFMAQKQSVTVADLSGVFKSRMSITDLQESAKELCCIAGNSDKLFALIKEQNRTLTVAGICKDSGQVQVTIPCPDESKLKIKTTCMSVHDRMLLLSDRENLFTVCTITGRIVGSRSLTGKPWSNIIRFEEDTEIVHLAARVLIEQMKLKSMEGHLLLCFPFLVVGLFNETPSYTLSTNDSTQYDFVNIEHGRVVFVAWPSFLAFPLRSSLNNSAITD